MVTLTYSPQEFAGQLSSYSAEAITMDPIWSVCGFRSKEIANGAAALALNARDAMVSGIETLTIEQLAYARVTLDSEPAPLTMESYADPP
jgi:hypothetical protein